MGRFKEVYDDPRWEPARAAVIARDRGLCQMCKAKRIVRAGNEIDHIIELTDDNKTDWNIAYNPDNLRCLCHQCHNERHYRKGSGLSDFTIPVLEK